MQPPYNPLERRLLSFYFSRVDHRDHADVYLVRNLPEEVRATLNGLYSRSHLSMRDALLARLKKGLEEAGLDLETIEIPEDRPDRAAEFLEERSGKFLKTYAIDHGHNSLREGSVLHVAVENVSQLVTRFMQRERRCSFEESSTRYISFSSEGHWRDPEVAAAGGEEAALYERTIQECFGFYNEASSLLADHVRRARPLGEGEDRGAWQRACRSEALDAARYLLLPCLFTKFGMVADARTFSDMVCDLMSHPLEEFRIVGRRLKEEGDRVAATLLTHAGPVPYRRRVREEEERIAGELLERPPRRAGRPEVALLSWDKDLDEKLLASLLYEAAALPMEEVRARVRALPPAARERLAEDLLAARGPHDAFPAGAEGALPFEFECLVDFGAYRDIGRHRKGFQQMQRLTTHHGFAVPPLVEEAGLEGRYREVLERAAEAHGRVSRRFPHAADYLVPFAFLQRVRILFDPRQTAYFIELRSAPDGHFSYREVAQRMHELVAEKAPLFARYVRVHKGRAFLGRLESEQTAEERRRRRMERAGEA